MGWIARRLFKLPIHLIFLGIVIGLTARVLYPPKAKELAPRVFKSSEVLPVDLDENEGEFTELLIEK